MDQDNTDTDTETDSGLETDKQLTAADLPPDAQLLSQAAFEVYDEGSEELEEVAELLRTGKIDEASEMVISDGLSKYLNRPVGTPR